MIPSCFSNPNNTLSTQSETPQNLVTSIYQTHLFTTNNQNHTQLTLTWAKTLISHSLTIHSPHLFSLTIPLHPSPFSIFRTRTGSGSKSISLPNHARLKLYWDFTRAEFTHNSSEPNSGFFLSIVSKSQIIFLLGDLEDEAVRRIGSTRMGVSARPTLLARREHVFGRRRYGTTAEFMGAKHEIGIEWGGGVLRVRIDGKVGVVVKRVGWKFRGNERIVVGGMEVEFYWDVMNWVSKDGGGCGVFVFEVGEGGGGVRSEMVGEEKRLMRKKGLLCYDGGAAAAIQLSPSVSSSSVLQWAEESSDGGRSSSSSSSTTRSCGSGGAGGGGFSLLLYAWRSN